MSPAPNHTTQLELCLQRFRDGDRGALDELLRHSADRLRQLVRQMLAGFPKVKRWSETDDVLQNALVRLVRALEDVRPDSARVFFALAATQIRRELIDLARHYYGPEGVGANHASDTGGSGRARHEPSDHANEPAQLAQWCEFHQQIDRLVEDEREIVGLLFYQGLTQQRAAELVGVSVRTVQRRWHRALVTLHDTIGDDSPI